MGNCSLKGVVEDCPHSIRILTDYGDIVEFKGPKLAKDVLHEYPGYSIFRQGHASSPLSAQEMGRDFLTLKVLSQIDDVGLAKKKVAMEWINETEPPKMSSSAAAMDCVDDLATGPVLEVLPTLGDGVWRVKLVINTKQLEEILSEQVNTEALIEKMRMAASSASLTPRRSKSSWKPALSNVFRAPH
ncbi:PLASTID MOVEMENT IMPAIRED PROTEIN-RELATED [Salix koriyanagi]|uniref:PLASTID MOVEMENT IMPAIRED PROTEIN-RELATED n=1 Tax=Salix koriyanagi TaxID=2511006 RepID=A0A9Q0T647_9ROSI|nr:PLASTID MOVEMENT IMPAIRED PROTEIN-RELATED [Salix koriyanagi]